MIAVGLLTVDLQIPASRSLKNKRKVMSSITSRLRQRLNVAVAEVDFLDKWQRGRIGISAVSNETHVVEKLLRQAMEMIEGSGLVVVLDSEFEIL